jgi:hypothetical protein
MPEVELIEHPETSPIMTLKIKSVAINFLNIFIVFPQATSPWQSCYQCCTSTADIKNNLALLFKAPGYSIKE